MSVRLSQAFATHRTAVIESLKSNLSSELVPNFNAEVENIRRVHEEETASLGAATADHRKKANIMDLKVRQQEFIKGLNEELIQSLTQRVADYKGKLVPKTITAEKGEKKVLEAEFPDGSTARVPQALWIDYSVFHRV